MELEEEFLEYLEEERVVDPDLVPDRTLPLPKDKYRTRDDADERFREIQAKHNYILIGTEETALYWVYFVLDRRTDARQATS